MQKINKMALKKETILRLQGRPVLGGLSAHAPLPDRTSFCGDEPCYDGRSTVLPYDA